MMKNIIFVVCFLYTGHALKISATSNTHANPTTDFENAWYNTFCWWCNTTYGDYPAPYEWGFAPQTTFRAPEYLLEPDLLKSQFNNGQEDTGCPLSIYGSCAKTFIADYPAVCYEQIAYTPPGTLELILEESKASGMYDKSRIQFGFDCEQRGFAYDKKVHPCYPEHCYTAFYNEAAQNAYRHYRDEKFNKATYGLGESVNVTEWMLTGQCVATASLEEELQKRNGRGSRTKILPAKGKGKFKNLKRTVN